MKRSDALTTRRWAGKMYFVLTWTYTLLTFVESMATLVGQVTRSASSQDATTEMSTYFKEVMHSRYIKSLVKSIAEVSQRLIR